MPPFEVLNYDIHVHFSLPQIGGPMLALPIGSLFTAALHCIAWDVEGVVKPLEKHTIRWEHLEQTAWPKMDRKFKCLLFCI